MNQNGPIVLLLHLVDYRDVRWNDDVAEILLCDLPRFKVLAPIVVGRAQLHRVDFVGCRFRTARRDQCRPQNTGRVRQTSDLELERPAEQDERLEALAVGIYRCGLPDKNDVDMKYVTPIVYSTGRDLIPHFSLQCNDLPVVAKDALRTFLRFGRNSPHRPTTFECYLQVCDIFYRLVSKDRPLVPGCPRVRAKNR